MNYETGFAREEFKNYLAEFHDIDPCSKAMDIVDNLISYGLNNLNHSLDQLAYFLEDIIDVEFKEVAGFCEDSVLTNFGQESKREFMTEHEEYAAYEPSLE